MTEISRAALIADSLARIVPSDPGPYDARYAVAQALLDTTPGLDMAAGMFHGGDLSAAELDEQVKIALWTIVVDLVADVGVTDARRYCPPF